jgi:hypothetical protein
MKKHQNVSKNSTDITIPKIIHQTAPIKKEDWHPLWKKCQESWKKNFPKNEFEYILWNDDDIDNLIKNNFPEYYEFYLKAPLHIIKIDISRFFILYHYGGIYSDMDMFCYENFYNKLCGDLFLLESKKRSGGIEIFQNSLMASTKENPFWIDCAEEAIRRIELFGDYVYSSGIDFDKKIKLTSGPLLITEISLYKKYEDKICGLSEDTYNSISTISSNNVIVRNMQTGLWGNESRDHLKCIKDLFFESLTMEEFLTQDYRSRSGIDLNTIDFHKYRK